MSKVSTARSATGWADWIRFGAVILIINGSFGVIQGLVALVGPDTYFASVNGDLFLFDVQGWGWWNLAIGTLQILTAAALLRGALWARIVAVFLATISAFVQMLLIPVQPVWSLIVIAVDVLVIYAVTAHGEELHSDHRRATQG
jgi:hypothetical protein